MVWWRRKWGKTLFAFSFGLFPRFKVKFNFHLCHLAGLTLWILAAPTRLLHQCFCYSISTYIILNIFILTCRKHFLIDRMFIEILVSIVGFLRWPFANRKRLAFFGNEINLYFKSCSIFRLWTKHKSNTSRQSWDFPSRYQKQTWLLCKKNLLKILSSLLSEWSKNHITDLLAACSVENCEVSAGSKKHLEL